jgi:hypothetical protein
VKIAHITPPGLLHQVIDEDESYHLILSDIVRKYETYREFYRDRIRRGDTVILDTLAYEGRQSESIIDDLKTALDVLAPERPTMVVLPDRRGVYGREALQMCIEGAEALAGYHVGYMAVPHDETVAGYVRAAESIVKEIPVRCLALSFRMGVPTGVPRNQLARYLSQLGPSLHFLGMNRDMEDLLDPWVVENVLGVDSVKLVRWGLAGLLVTREEVPDYPGRGDDFFDITRTPHLAVIRENIRYWREELGW